MEMLGKIFNIAIWASTLRIATPILLASLGGVMSERSGVINIGLEGMMLMGAFGAAAGSYFYGPWIGMLIGITIGGIMGLIHAFMSVTVKANQIISATAINIFAVGFPNIMVPILWPGYRAITPLVPVIKDIRLPIISDLPVVGNIIGNQNPIVYIALILVPIINYFLFRTPLGLRIRSVGENPKAADTLGINVVKMRYIAVISSGFLAGMGGAFLSIAYQAQFSKAMTQGRGFIGLAAMIFGRWKPTGALIACLIFGFADALQASAQSAGVPIPPELLLATPYILTLIALVGLVGKRAIGPAAIGKPYEKE
ncbi:ABC transporter permease [bacterium]|nr:ABC transporter permease [bacterium]MBU4510727.1 ABC transporter permease [bacterium]